MASHSPHLLVDGYIATMFGPRDAPAYHSYLLGRGSGPLREYRDPRYPRLFLAAPPYIPGLDPHTPPWVIDQVIRATGTVVPQQRWVPRNLQYESLRPPIFFVQRNGELGLRLDQAAGGNCMSLQGASQPAPLGEASSTHAQIRINWRGYSSWDAQIMIRTQTQEQEIMPLERFVRHVAKKVQNFMREAAGRQPNNNDEPRWYIRPGGITPDDVVLIGVVHVSQGSWMPILQLNRFVW